MLLPLADLGVDDDVVLAVAVGGVGGGDPDHQDGGVVLQAVLGLLDLVDVTVAPVY